MADDKKSGPVNPPVLDLEAGSVKDKTTTDNKAKDRSGSAGSTSGARKPGASIPEWANPRNWPLGDNARLLGGVAAGAVLGAGLAFVLALGGLWPRTATPQTTSDADMAIAGLERRIETIENATGSDSAATTELADRIAALEQTAAETAGNSVALAELQADTAALAAREISAPAIDLSPLETELAALSSRVDALAAGASSDDASAISDELIALRSEIDALNQTFAGLQSDMTEFDRSVTALKAQTDTLQSTVEALTSDMNTASAPQEATRDTMRLPLALSGLEGALTGGRSFNAELALLSRALPDLNVPDTITAAAGTGLPAPGAVAQNLNAIIPDILAARPINPDAGWQAALTDRVRGVLALRPTGDVEGDSPEALVARLEAAVNRRDFRAASTLLTALPEPMRDAAASVADDIGVLAAAEALIVDARAMALEPLESQDL